jgi:hypothetical protein
VVELQVALEGDHRALGRQHVGPEGDPEHLAVLQGEPLPAVRDLEVDLVEELTVHGASLWEQVER